MTRASAALVLVAATAACGSPPPAEPPVVETEGPEAQILRVGTLWEARQGGKSFRSPPDQVSVIEVELVSSIRLERGQRQAKENLRVRETFTLRAGGTVTCVAKAELVVSLKYGLKSGDPAVEITRPETALARECDGPGLPEGATEISTGSARFVLRGDQLVGFAPALEKRTYLALQ